MEGYIRGEKGVDLRDVKKMNIKGKLLVTTSSGVVGFPLAEIKQFHKESCGVCGDFSSELADISVGGVGLDGWTLTVIRTEKGEEVFSGAEKSGGLRSKPLDAEAKAYSLMVRLSEKKRKNTIK
jgi:coenzyme F420 hydrogenase subunit beta